MIIFQRGDIFAGRFRLDERIGQGGMGQVWRATQLGLRREVALKLILPNVRDDNRFREMFLVEAQVSARLAHPNIVPVVDFGEAEGELLWLVQIFVQGMDLGKVIERAQRGLPLPIAGFIAGEILKGLQAAHDGGVVHRDLKPGNVLVSLAGDVQITDFGIAKVIGHDQTPSVSTMLKGSPGYLAPEILRGQPPRFTSDLFSVGGLFYELLTGRHPFIRSAYADRDQIFYATLNEPIPPLALDLPPEVEHVVQKLLARDPRERYATATQALEELLGVLAPVAREANALSLRRFLSASNETVIAGAERVRSSIGISEMAGQVAPPARTTTTPRLRARLATVTALAALAIGVGAVVGMARGTAPETPVAAAASPPSVEPAPPPSVEPAPPPEAVSAAASEAIAGAAPDAGVPDATPAAPPDAGAAATPATRRRRSRSGDDWILPGADPPASLRVR
jgi:eukaryotic-like serine/threonine-protein kinase